MSRTISASGGDSCVASPIAAGGVWPSRTRPWRVPPSSRQSARNRRSTWRSAGHGERLSGFSPHCTEKLPLIPIVSPTIAGLIRSRQSPHASCVRVIRLSMRRSSSGVSAMTCTAVWSVFGRSVRRTLARLTSNASGPALYGRSGSLSNSAGSYGGRAKALRSRITSPLMRATPRARNWRSNCQKCSSASRGSPLPRR